jgi:hypothetical protein
LYHEIAALVVLDDNTILGVFQSGIETVPLSLIAQGLSEVRSSGSTLIPSRQRLPLPTKSC